MAYNKAEQHETSAVFFHRGKSLMGAWASMTIALQIAKDYDLIVFDYDRTLAAFNSDQLYKEVGTPSEMTIIEYLRSINPSIQFAILTNRGDVVYGYSTIKQARERLNLGARKLGIKEEAIYIAWGITYKGKWTIPAAMKLGDPGTAPEERKPGGALLRKIMEDFGVEPEDTLMIGDSLTDIGAAASVGSDGLLVKMERY